MTTPVKQQILNQTTELQQRLAQMQENIDKLSPSEQIIAATQLQDDSLLVTELQKKVYATYMRYQGAIPGITEEELLAISEKLSASVEILESIDKNNEIAMACIEIVSEVEALHQTSVAPNDREIKFLQGRIRDLTSVNPVLNKGNREALEVASQALQSMLSQQIAVQNSSNRQSPQPVLSEDQKIIQASNEDYQASLFKDQFSTLESKYINDPLQDFVKVLAHYIEVKKYAISKSFYVSNTAGPAIADHLQQLEKSMNEMIQAQTSKENEQAQQVQGRAEQMQVLHQLSLVIEQGLSSKNIPSQFSTINGTFLKLSSEEKHKLFAAVDEIQKATSKRNIGIALVGQPFSSWPATWTQKKQALEKIMAASKDPATPIVTVKQTDEMKRCLQEAKNMQSMQTPSQVGSDRTMHRTSPSIPRHFSSELYLPDDIDISTLNFGDVLPPSLQDQGEISAVGLHPNIAVIHDLQALLALLRSNATVSQLQEACLALQMMDSKKLTGIFKMSDMNLRAISDRPFYHIYLIHKDEAPQKLKTDMLYGNKAFAGVYPATNEERLRSVQRTIVELVLENLEDAINFENHATVVQLLDILESIKLDVKDRAEGQENVAYNLFSAFYHLHVAARNGNPSLIHPNDPQFNGDFGRAAFRKFMPDAIDPAIQIAAINQVRNTLKTAWKV
jgi:hypothetical protein